MLLTSTVGNLLSPPLRLRRSRPRRLGHPRSQEKRGRGRVPTARGGRIPDVWNRGRGWRGGAARRSFGYLRAGVAAPVEPHWIRRPIRVGGQCGRCGPFFRILLHARGLIRRVLAFWSALSALRTSTGRIRLRCAGFSERTIRGGWSATRTFTARCRAAGGHMIAALGVFGVRMVRSQTYAEPPFAVLMRASLDLVANEPALPKTHTEHLLCLRLLAGIVAPHLVLLVEGSRRRHDAFAHYAPVFNKRGEGVHLSTVLVCCLPHALWFSEAVLLPLETAFDHPRQDAGHLGPQLLGQLRVLAITVESLCKRNQAYPVPNGIVGALYDGLVVSREPELELGPEVERLSEQVPGRYRVATGELLDLTLCEAPTLLHLGCRDKPRTFEGGHVVTDALIALHKERLSVGVGGVVTHHVPEQLCQGRLAVLTEAVEDR